MTRSFRKHDIHGAGRSLLLGVALFLLALVAGCDGCDREDGKPADTAAVDTSKRVSSNLPSGRFQLPTAHSPVPALWLTLPEGYRVKVGTPTDTGNTAQVHDEYFIINSDDPSIARPNDPSIVTPGFMRVYVGPVAQRGMDSAGGVTEKSGMLAGVPVVWRMASEPLPDGRTYWQRELRTRDLFARLSPELSKLPLYLHIYIAGADSVQVAALVGAAESLGLAP